MLRSTLLKAALALASVVTLQICILAEDKPAGPPDTVTFVNGETLTGTLTKVADGKVTFHSEMVGDVTFEWAKVKTLKTAKPFAVIAKDQKLNHASKVPEGMVEVADGQITAGGAPTATEKVAYVVDQPTFDKNLAHHPGWTEGWIGAITAGVSLVQATQNSTNFTSAVALIRKSPPVDWMATRSRTVLDFSNSYGKVTQPGTPDAKTNIFHADAEQDEYFNDRFYGLGHLAFDHNFSQGLDLQQLYGAGLGYTVLKDKVQELDVKGDLHYEKQQFFVASSNQNLIGSEFAESYTRKLKRGMILTQGVLYDAAWNNTSAYSAQALVGLAAPVSKKFSLSINLLDGYLNNPPAGFKKNSFQFTTGLTYTMK